MIKEGIDVRLQHLVNKLGISKKKMSERADVSTSQLSDVINRKRGTTQVWLKKIIVAFPEVNSDWLYFGKGRMSYGSLNGIKIPTHTQKNIMAEKFPPQNQNTDIELIERMSESKVSATRYQIMYENMKEKAEDLKEVNTELKTSGKELQKELKELKEQMMLADHNANTGLSGLMKNPDQLSSINELAQTLIPLFTKKGNASYNGKSTETINDAKTDDFVQFLISVTDGLDDRTMAKIMKLIQHVTQNIDKLNQMIPD